MQQITDLELYLLSIVDEKYIDLDNSFIGNNGEIFLKIKTDILPIPTGIGYKTAENLLNALYYHSKDIYVVCNFEGTPIDIKAKLTLSDMGKYIGIMYYPDVVSVALIKLEEFKHIDYCKYIEQTNMFKKFTRDYIKLKIRESLFVDTTGEFVADQITGNAYLQRRNYNNEDIFYIMPEWWDNLISGTVEWTDVDNGYEKTFVSVRC